jgi:uncharacterized protein YdaU (DUF1376 family)
MNAPYFPLFVNNWLGSSRISALTPAEEGAYIRLLCYEWNDQDCSLPTDDDALASLSRLGTAWPKSAARLRALFDLENGRLYNPKLLSLRIEADKLREKKHAGGVAGMLSRWHKIPIRELLQDDNPTPTPTPTPTETPKTTASSVVLPSEVPPTERIAFDISAGKFSGFTPQDLGKLKEAFPACDVVGEIMRAAVWLQANPGKRKRNNYRFVTNWLTRQQERGGSLPSAKGSTFTRSLTVNELQTQLKLLEDEQRRLADIAQHSPPPAPGTVTPLATCKARIATLRRQIVEHG